MPNTRRKVPFSGKKKKEYLKNKKQVKPFVDNGEEKKNYKFLVKRPGSDDESKHDIQKINAVPGTSQKGIVTNSNRYALQFFRETREEIEAKKLLASKEIEPVPVEQLEIKIEDYFPVELDFPKRPPWNANMSKERLDAIENKYFREYVSNLEKQFDIKRDLSLFELNLETWRQLWRVLEKSDILLIIVDIRFPVLMFPPSLYNYVVNELNKDMILVLNKIDLAPPSLVVAWSHYFKKHFPSLEIVMFTSFPSYNVVGKTEDKAGLQVRRRKGRLRMAAEGAQKLLDACKEIVKDEVDLSSWQKKIKEEMELDIFDDDDEIVVGETIESKPETTYEVHERFKDGVLTIGCVGQPNVGKSSLMNAVMGKKVVSVSRTPGHTKHFQTIFLTPTVKLCDCPGLVFPSKVPKSLQVLMGSFPIAQLRAPIPVVKYVAERLDLVKLLKVQHPDDDESWSAVDICDGWAIKRGFKTSRTGRPDTYRAANSILRMVLEGKITLCLRPEGYSKEKGMWEMHEDVAKVKWVQAKLEKIENAYTPHLVSDESSDPDSGEDCSSISSTRDKNGMISGFGDNGGASNCENSTNDEGSEDEDDNSNPQMFNRFSALID